MAPSTSNFAASSTVTSSTDVPQSATWSNKKLKRDKFRDQWRNIFSWLVMDDDLAMYISSGVSVAPLFNR